MRRQRIENTFFWSVRVSHNACEAEINYSSISKLISLLLSAAVPLLFSFNTLWSSTFSRKKFRTPIRFVWSQGQSACMLMTDKSLSFFMSCLKAQSVFLPKHSPYNVPSVSSFRLFLPPSTLLVMSSYTRTQRHIFALNWCFGLARCIQLTEHKGKGTEIWAARERRMICATEAIYGQQLLSLAYINTCWLHCNLNISLKLL